MSLNTDEEINNDMEPVVAAREIIIIRPCCPLCRGAVDVFDQPDDYIRYVCHKCNKIIAITELDE